MLHLLFKIITLDLSKFQQEFSAYKEAQNLTQEPKNLYEPIRYILSLGGKKIRPVLTLMAASLFSDEYKKALPAAYAVEMFHNFTLVHDDIMDDAPLRRGKETVHEKWNSDIAVLSGDVLMVKSYQLLGNIDPIFLWKTCAQSRKSHPS